MRAALTARSSSRWPTPNFLTCSLSAVNTVITEERLLLWRFRTRPIHATSGMGHRRTGRGLSGTARGPWGFPQRAHFTHREDLAVLETQTSDDALISPVFHG